MTDRDRLAVKICKATQKTNFACKEAKCVGKGLCAHCYVMADDLLANGIIAPPCKVGDTVYIPVSNTILHTKVFAFGVDEDGNKVINPKEYPEGVFCVVGCEIGKTVFLTKEEAEAKLKECEG